MTRTQWAPPALLGIFLGLASSCSDIGERADERTPPPSGDPQVNAALGLDRSESVRPNIVLGEDGQLSVTIAIDGQERELELRPQAVRSHSFQLFVQDEDGALMQIEAPTTKTVAGEVVGLPGSVVTGALMDDGLHARIAMTATDVYWTEPAARVSPYATSDYVLYRDSDVSDVPRTCGLDGVVHDAIQDLDLFSVRAEGSSGLAIAEVAVDADYEFYQAWGSVDGAVARMEAVIAAINVQYEGEVGIRHVITAAIVRTTEADPYTSTSPSVILQDELRPEWLNNHGDIQRDVVHLFTGKDLDGSTIGIAYVGAVCGSFAFGLSQSNFSSNFSCVTDLTAHEMGHNWAANHCDCPNNTMNPFLTCANTFNADATIPTIEGHRDSRTCLSYGDACPDDPDKTEPGQCGCGVPDTDTDLDGTADCIDGCPDDPNKTDPGMCGCGVIDEHSDGDGVADCIDGCPMDGNKLEPGQCGCGVPDTDTDGDGTADCVDGCPLDPTSTNPADCSDPVCGDGTCDAGETPCNCPTDCGEPPASEQTCGDAVDNDCDGLADCDDPDCAADEACVVTCQPDGATCSDNADCCSDKCRGSSGSKTCKSTSGGGGGSDTCGQVGDSCKNNGDCCSRECSSPPGARFCQEPSAGVLQPLSSEFGEGERSAGLTGGCAATSSPGSGLAVLLLAWLALACARRRRSGS